MPHVIDGTDVRRRNASEIAIIKKRQLRATNELNKLRAENAQLKFQLECANATIKRAKEVTDHMSEWWRADTEVAAGAKVRFERTIWGLITAYVIGVIIVVAIVV